MKRSMVLAWAWALAMAGAAVAAAAERPNIVFILADDIGMGDLGCYGQKKIQTPHLDRLAAEGMRFEYAYSGTSVCAPSRASLMTGLSTGHCPIRGNRRVPGGGQMPLPESTPTVAQILKKQGYKTACFGKWGMGRADSTGGPLKKGFDRFFGYNCQKHAHDYFTDRLDDDDRTVPLPGKPYSADLIARRMMEWLEKNGRDGPFFLFYATTLPHPKYQIDDLRQYGGKDWPENGKAYAAMVSRLDEHVGKIAAWLKKNGLEKKTLILFSGDNGAGEGPGSPIGRLFRSNLRMRGFKRSMYDGGLRNCAIACWPGRIRPGQTCSVPWYFPDFLPTAAALSGAALPKGFESDGVSILPILFENRGVARKPMYWELHEGRPIQAVRFGNWKAVRNGVKAPIELYDLSADPGERKDLAKERPERVAEAERLMRELRTDDPNWPLEGRRKKGRAAKKGKAAKKGALHTSSRVKSTMGNSPMREEVSRKGAKTQSAPRRKQGAKRGKARRPGGGAVRNDV